MVNNNQKPQNKPTKTDIFNIHGLHTGGWLNEETQQPSTMTAVVSPQRSLKKNLGVGSLKQHPGQRKSFYY